MNQHFRKFLIVDTTDTLAYSLVHLTTVTPPFYLPLYRVKKLSKVKSMACKTILRMAR